MTDRRKFEPGDLVKYVGNIRDLGDVPDREMLDKLNAAMTVETVDPMPLEDEPDHCWIHCKELPFAFGTDDLQLLVAAVQ